MTFSFFTKVDFNGEELEVELEANIIKGGFRHQFGFKEENEIESIMLISPQNEKEVEYIEDLISEGHFDNLVWDKYNCEISV